MILKDPRISILINDSGATIEVRDNIAATTFLEVKLTAEQLTRALSRIKHVECDAEVMGLDRVGKVHTVSKFDFEIPRDLRGSANSAKVWVMCNDALDKNGMSEWFADRYFGSQDSFYEKDGKSYARATIRKWTADVTSIQ